MLTNKDVEIRNEAMNKYKINPIQDNEGFKIVLTENNEKSKVWNGQFYDFNREIVQTNGFEVYEIEADSFNHAIDKIQYQKRINSLVDSCKNLRLQLTAIEDRLIQKLGRKLKGLKRRSKINSFLR